MACHAQSSSFAGFDFAFCLLIILIMTVIASLQMGILLLRHSFQNQNNLDAAVNSKEVLKFNGKDRYDVYCKEVRQLFESNAQYDAAHRQQQQTMMMTMTAADVCCSQMEAEEVLTDQHIGALTNILDKKGDPSRVKVRLLMNNNSLDDFKRDLSSFLRDIEVKVLRHPRLYVTYAEDSVAGPEVDSHLTTADWSDATAAEHGPYAGDD